MLRLGQEIIIFDGGMGSEIEKLGLDGIPEDLNLTNSEDIKNIHRSYSCADVITTNTFGLNRIKYKGKYALREIALKAVENARIASKHVFFDIGPTGAMLKPLGTLTFDEAYSAFAEIVNIVKDEVDGFIAETFSDLYEMKACVLAVKENTDKPLFATMTFDNSGRTLTGSSPEIVVNTLEGLGVDALGVNCSAGPKELESIVNAMLAVSGIPVIVQPNCGLPLFENGKTRYSLSVEDFTYYIQKFIKAGVSVVGGCCGTAPEHIRSISKLRQAVVKTAPKKATVINSATQLVEIDGVKICGERLNPTGKSKLKQAIFDGDFGYLIDEAVKQAEAGADILDLNVGIPNIDEPAVMKNAICKIQEYVNLPLQIDSSDKDAIEKGARYYNGVPLINSVNGESAVMRRVFPVAKKYGAVVLGLTMDENGVPPTAEQRFEIAKRIISEAAKYGIPKHKIMIDTLVVTASAEQMLVKETVEAVRLVRTLGVKTALGVSNVSFGLPNRGLLNRTFLSVAVTCGLNMPIMNPLDGDMSATVKALAVLSGSDKNSADYIQTFKDCQISPTVVRKASEINDSGDLNLYDCVLKGLDVKAEELCAVELETREPLDVVNGVLIKALGQVGEMYEKGQLFLPQLVSSAEAAKKAFAVISEKLPKGAENKEKVVLATVKGDVHDIGKNIVKVVLESYGYNVIDLGKDVPAESVLKACEKYKPKAVGLSALMTTTVKSMEETIAFLRKHKCSCKIFVGGAVLNAETAKNIDADYYTKDALELVKKLQTI